jgi:hypothetical protein
MCFSENMSLAIGLSGICFGIYFYDKNLYASIGILYFALMEIIQFFQYKVINKCNNKYNKFLTYLGYIHICFQPVFFNIWLFAFTKKPNFIYIYISLIAGILLLSRIFFVKNHDLCNTNTEPLCGEKTCSFWGNKHIAWNVRLRAPGWLTPSISLHFFMWIIPTLVAFEIKPIIAVLLTGPYLGWIMTNNIHERPAIWCYTVVAQLVITFYLLKK